MPTDPVNIEPAVDTPCRAAEAARIVAQTANGLSRFTALNTCQMNPTSDTAPCARVNGAYMRENLGRKVRLVCKQESISGRVMTVLAADNARLTVNLAEGNAYDTEYIEFEGIVDSETVLTEHSHTNFGNSFGAFGPSGRCMGSRLQLC